MKIANLVICRSVGREWVAQERKNIPEWVKTEEVIADLVAGAIVEKDDEFYRAKDMGPSPLVMPNRDLRVAH